MLAELLELLPELLGLGFFGLGTVVLSVAGVYAERVALVTVQSGQSALGAWMAFMGVMAFFFAYLMATDKLRPRLSTVSARLSERAN